MEKLDRKQFLMQSAKWGGCCGVALLAGATSGICDDSDKQESVFSPCEHRVKQGQDVIKRIILQMDQKLDKDLREEMMENCGRLCHDGAHPNTKQPTPENAARFMEGMHNYVGKDGIQQEGEETVVHFKYTQNPRGLKVADGYCLCPILEDAPKDVSPTYCHCSVGYVKAIFEQGLGKQVKVELTESVLRGGKGCSFEVRFKTS